MSFSTSIRLRSSPEPSCVWQKFPASFWLILISSWKLMAFLVTQGVGPDTVTTRGYGESNPVASNATASGRQQNRRVELVVSGEAIGSTTTSTTTTTTGNTGGASGATQGTTAPAQPTTAAPGSIAAPSNPPQNTPPPRM